MHYDIHFRSDVVNKIKDVVNVIHEWNEVDSTSENEIEALSEYVQTFDHCPKPDRPFLIGGADGSGDFPCVCYGDSVIYLVTATARLYAASLMGGLSERKISECDIVDFLWLPEDKKKAKEQYLDFFSHLVRDSLDNVCQKSDYYSLSKSFGVGFTTPSDLLADKVLILPPCHDANNIGIQLMTTAEAGVLIRMIQTLDHSNVDKEPIYLLEDTTLALPMVSVKSTLFFEIAKRYACKLAEEAGVTYLTISKSHNMPHMDLIEDMIKEKVPSGEHWFMRLPIKNEKKPKFLGERRVPPVGAVSYIFKFHNTTQPMRLDMDLSYWEKKIWDENKEIMSTREKQMFRDLDYASHDQRCYGYPYPIKACHDMASLTKDERVALRKQVIDEAVKAGLKRKNFIDPSIAAGHK